ncbi:hypothetical protein XENTR_v10013746 [Xenopus tropicalis]|uniref:Ras-related protein Rab n=1 Tax=Xenopus tropicalis TaxID=8364 RepID=A0A6I8RJB5_XENTR|nr:ras-related protein Rab-32 isoform X1 [Xenopus tropicalis]KAE8601652.1 hypothetical protein XENTR_v10013746 [Xenopus tropicalis]|eukprot:XP_012818396.1 PREDICTED: ras-related protein Rab-32 isoform X1 [Xenopus tropicalis]
MAGEGAGGEPSSPRAPERKEYLFKVLVIGELGVGKTSIIKRYVHQLFSQHYRATIGVDFALKVINWDSSTLVRLQLWDIAALQLKRAQLLLYINVNNTQMVHSIQSAITFALSTTGQERFGNMTRVYYKEAVGAFVVFDVTRGSTFEAITKWKSDLDSKVFLPSGGPIPAVLLANKCDQKKENSLQSPHQMDNFCKENGFAAWFETSAKDNMNIDEAARCLVENILANAKNFPVEENDDGSIRVDQEAMPAESKFQCC